MSARRLLSSLIFCAVILTFGTHEARTEILAPVWSKHFGDANSQWSSAVAADDKGNVFLAGYFTGTIDLGGGPLTSAGAEDIFVAKFNANGNHRWSRRFGDASSQKLRGVAFDHRGNVLITGGFMGTIDFGGGPLTSAGSYDIYLAMFDSDGSYCFGQRFGDAGTQEAFGVASGGFKHCIVITGTFWGSVDFQGDLITSNGGSDVFMAEFDMDGSIETAHGYGGAGSDGGQSCAIDTSGNAIITGYFESATIDFGGGPLARTGVRDAFLAKFDQDEAHLWSKRFGGEAVVNARSVAVTGSGDMLLSGDFWGSVSFGGSLLSASDCDIFLAKFDQSGNHSWSKDFGGWENQFGMGVSADSEGNVVITGYFESAADFGGGLLVASGIDLYVARFDPDGNHIWSRRYGDVESQYGNAVAIDGSDNVIVAGEFEGTMAIADMHTSAGNEDAFVAKFRPALAEASIVSCLDIPHDEGGWLRLKVAASGHDEAYAQYPIFSYTAWRKIAPTPAALAAGIPAGEPQLLGLPPGAWEAVGYANATQDPHYYFAVPTKCDSTASGIARETFIVTAHTGTPTLYYTSAADSGYSVDNLAPAMPLGLEGEQSFAPEGLALAWTPNVENDLAGYHVYRGTSAGFVPAPGNRIGSPAAAGFFDGGWDWSDGYYYKVAAVDRHGNESGYALLAPEAITGAETPKAPEATYLRQNFPNPFNPTTRIAFGLAAPSNVSLRIYDASGRLVRALVDEQRAAGNYSELWDGRDSNGSAVASGIYFYRLTAGSFTQTRKMALLR